MNVQISIFIPFSGTTDGLTPIVAALSQTLIDLGYGVEDDRLGSLITVDESMLSEWSDTTDFAKHLMETSPMWAIPNKGEETYVSTGD